MGDIEPTKPETNLKKKLLKILSLAAVVGIVIASLTAKDKPSLDKDLPVLDVNKSDAQIMDIMTGKALPPVVQLFRKGKFYCTAFVIGNNYALTAAHCLVDDDGYKTDEQIEIRLDNKPTGTIGKAVGIYGRRDLGLIKGDFSRFGMLPVSNESPGISGGQIITCGFPGGNKHVTCTNFTPIIMDAFFIKGVGIIMPGMSGGPVIDVNTGMVIGINVHVYYIDQGGGAGVTSAMGVLGHFGIEP